MIDTMTVVGLVLGFLSIAMPLCAWALIEHRRNSEVEMHWVLLGIGVSWLTAFALACVLDAPLGFGIGFCLYLFGGGVRLFDNILVLAGLQRPQPNVLDGYKRAVFIKGELVMGPAPYVADQARQAQLQWARARS